MGSPKRTLLWLRLLKKGEKEFDERHEANVQSWKRAIRLGLTSYPKWDLERAKSYQVLYQIETKENYPGYELCFFGIDIQEARENVLTEIEKMRKMMRGYLKELDEIEMQL